MIDWHCHLLPQIDDGSKDVEQSLEILASLSEQNIDTVIATPHFFVNDESPDSFFERRSEAYEKLKERLTSSSPEILLGAEVRYYPGISRLTDLQKFSIGNSKLLLLEMPMSKWTQYTAQEVIEISSQRNIKVILAHIERYLHMQNASVINSLYSQDIMMQINSSFLTGMFSRKKALSMLGEGIVQFIGSDCHNTTSRPPKIKGAYDTVEKYFGEDFVAKINDFGYAQLKAH